MLNVETPYKSVAQNLTPFHVGVTFEMRELSTEKSIFRLIKIAVSQHLLSERGKGKVAERQRERGVSVRV
jgi:hypothetical protein